MAAKLLDWVKNLAYDFHAFKESKLLNLGT